MSYSIGNFHHINIYLFFLVALHMLIKSYQKINFEIEADLVFSGAICMERKDGSFMNLKIISLLSSGMSYLWKILFLRHLLCMRMRHKNQVLAVNLISGNLAHWTTAHQLGSSPTSVRFSSNSLGPRPLDAAHPSTPTTSSGCATSARRSSRLQDHTHLDRKFLLGSQILGLSPWIRA